ncbi:B3 domain-containing protein LOC_Os12g40090-like [Carex rostrata]
MKGGVGPSMNSFFVKMDSSLMHTMNIPKEYGKIFRESIRENVELEGPSGITWHVKTIRLDKTLTLQSGWKDFVTANQIDKNDILVFTYNGNSSFKVLIFDPSGCQKAAPFFAKKMVTETESEKSNDSLIREIASPHCEVKKENICSSDSDSDESSCDILSCAALVPMTGERVCCKRNQREFVQEPSKSDEGEHLAVRKTKTKENIAAKVSSLYVIPRGTHLTKAHEKIANRMARKAQKGSDLFVKILTPCDTPSSRDCLLRVPAAFACDVLESKMKKITLLAADLDKRSKRCTANYCKNKSHRYIGQGWRKFVCSNGLKQGDLCLFELRKQEKRGILTMIVPFNWVSS